MIHVRNDIYRCPVCGEEKVMKAFEARQDITCSPECGYALREAKKLAVKKHESKERFKDLTEKQHDYISRSHTKLYNVWNSMKQRCYNPKAKSYQNYGAKGVEICEEWRNDYKAFAYWALKNGYKETQGKLSGDTLTISRYGDSGNYEPANCSFKTHSANSAMVENGMNKQIHAYSLSDGSYHSSYKSMSDAGRALDIEMKHIAESMDPDKPRKQVGGFIFSFEKKDKIEPPANARNTTPIEAFSPNGDSVGIFKTKKEASVALGISGVSNISKVLNGTRKHAKGYTFKYIR